MEGTKRMGIVDFRSEVGKRLDAAFYLQELTFITKGPQEELRGVLIPPQYYDVLKEALATKGVEIPAATLRAES